MDYNSNEIYLSGDVEADGPIPGPFSMLQFGVSAHSLNSTDPRVPFATFEANLERLQGAGQDPGTMEWWGKQGDAYANTRIEAEDPHEAMFRFVTWCKALPGKLVFVGYPVTYDFMWLYWYVMSFGVAPGERCPFGFQGLDIKTLAFDRLPTGYRGASKRRMPKHWFEGAPKHTHDGLDDAIGQGTMFVNIVKDDEEKKALTKKTLEDLQVEASDAKAKQVEQEQITLGYVRHLHKVQEKTALDKKTIDHLRLDLSDVGHFPRCPGCSRLYTSDTCPRCGS